MKKMLVALVVSLSAAVSAVMQAQQAPVPEIPYDVVPHFLKMPPNLYLGEAAGVAVNSKGHVFVFNRGTTTGPAYAAAAAQLLEFGPDGTFIREIVRGPAFSDHYEGESAAVVIVRRAYSLGLRPLRAR